MTRIHKSEAEGYLSIQIGGGNVTREAEIGVMGPPVKNAHGYQRQEGE